MRIFINEKDYSKNLVVPVKVQNALDEALDQAVITLVNMKENEPFEPLSAVRIGNDLTMLISIDKVTQTNYGNNVRFKHEITLIEETKYLEKFFVDTCTFTNSLARRYILGDNYAIYNQMTKEQLQGFVNDYSNASEDRDFNIHSNGKGQVNSQLYRTPIFAGGILQIRSFLTAFGFGIGTADGLGYYEDAYIQVISPDGEILFYLKSDSINDLGWDSSERTTDKNIGQITIQKTGTYTIQYAYVGIDNMANPKWYAYGINYTIYAVNRTLQEKSDITITDVVERLLEITETKRYGVNNRFNFNQEQSYKYKNILAPEFAFTKMTLKEALQQVGGYIHAIPRLKGNTIYFDELGQREYASLPKQYLSYESTQDIEQFCSEIDSNVDNLVNIDDEQSGTIIEPFNGGWKTPRVELGTVDVQQNNCFFETTKPIEKIIKVEIGYLPNNEYIGDITPFVYEQSEYSVLDSYDGIYPYSKAYAIYYMQGKNNIYGLNFEEENAISQVFENPAIINIINSVRGTSYSLDSMVKLQYRIAYIPVVSARIKQRKPYLKSTSKKAILAYNASANKVDTDYYGENLKGAVARLGNIEKTLTYKVKNINQVPKIGTLFDKDYYISVVKYEIYTDYVKFTIGLSKDFNRLNEYVGIDNNQRFYEVSEKQAVERYVLYEDYLVVGSSQEFPIEPTINFGYANQSLIEGGMLTAIKNRFLASGDIDKNCESISCMEVVSQDENLEIINSKVILPSVSFALGNSAFFQISYNNNFGAGTFIQGFLTNTRGTQAEVEYGDVFGNVKYLSIDGFTKPYDTSWNYNDAVAVGSKIPITDVIAPDVRYGSLFTTGEYPIYIDKDSREIINLGYQIHCVTNNENIIIGSGLAKTMPISASYVEKNGEITYKQATDIYIMPREIGEFENKILDLPSEDMRIAYTMQVDTANKQLNFGSITCNKDGKSIILVDRKNGELVFAINEDVKSGQIYQLPSLMFRHKIFD